MRILNFGSLNIDYVYLLDHFVRPGETLSSEEFFLDSGGKGLNQSIALAHAGVQVYQAGMIGKDGEFLKEILNENGVDTQYIETIDEPTGNAIIQVDKKGQNCIILFGGANHKITSEYINKVFSSFNKGDYIVLQNEINCMDLIIKKAKEKEMIVVFNPAPMSREVHLYPLELVDILIVNEVEGEELSGEKEPEKIIEKLLSDLPKTAVILTLGENGSIYADKTKRISCSVGKNVKVIDTTAAGDTYIGYFVAMITTGKSVKDAMKIASKACDICVSKSGAAETIPYLQALI
ncbi:ribokinase [Clostridium sediminicola]|uniref:ribokinase n=1 Tax=Clostridium sediminicola TaxID=3114879 RepID=UPI0031F23EFC